MVGLARLTPGGRTRAAWRSLPRPSFILSGFPPVPSDSEHFEGCTPMVRLPDRLRGFRHGGIRDTAAAESDPSRRTGLRQIAIEELRHLMIKMTHQFLGRPTNITRANVLCHA